MRAKLTVVLLLGLAAAVLPAQNIAQFDAVVDFDTGLRELGRLLAQKRAADPGKLYILTGTVSDVMPKAAWFFTLHTEEILDPAALLTEIRRGGGPLALYLRKSLSEATGRLVDAYAPGSRPSAALVDAVLKDLNDQIRKGAPLASGVAQSLKLSAGLRALLATTPAEDDERGYLSRLLLEEGLNGIIAPVEVQIELVAGEWIGTEEVRSYHALLLLSGPESYKAFVRRRPPAPGAAVIATGARVVAVASLVEPIELIGGTPAWLVEAHHIRPNR